MTDIAQKLKSLPLFRGVSSRDLEILSTEIHLKTYTAKEVIYTQGSVQKQIYILLRGSVRLQIHLPTLDIKVLCFLGRSEIVGLEMLWMPHPRAPHSAVANENITLLEIPLNIFKSHFLVLRPVQDTAHAQWTERFLELQRDICVSHCLAPYRVARFLLRVLDTQAASLGNRLQLPLNRGHIAQKVGSQSETVTRILSQWTKSSWIKTDEHHIEILDRQALLDIRPHRKPQKK